VPQHTKPYDNVLETIGWTPLIRINKVARGIRTPVYAKAEFFNPGGSVKDRIATGMILDAEKSGRLKRGMTLIEPTAGNTGVGLALVGVQLGYRVIFVVPEGMADEKVILMRALGAEVIRTPQEERMTAAIAKAEALTRELPGAVCLQQFANPSNPDAHFNTTGPEIWNAMEGRIDAIVIGAGTGGTFTGVVNYLRSMKPEIKAILVEPQGSVFQGGPPGPHKVEGIGNSFIPPVLDLKLADQTVMIDDKTAYQFVDRLAREEGLLVGGSSGAACAAACATAAKMRPGQRLVTIFPDSAERYLSKYKFDGKL
jgi:O-acetylserine dependent cystathionine beta-synthase